MVAWYVLTAGCLLLLTGTGQLVAVAARWRAEQNRRQAAIAAQRADSRHLLAELDRGCLELAERRPAWPGWRRLRVWRIEQEGTDCRSFYLRDAEEAPLPPFRAGQYLTVGLSAGERPDVARCYSLSQACNPRHYRITVKRIDGGAISTRLFAELAEGDTLWAKAPAGQFVAPPGHGPLVLVGGGIGITPLVAIAQESSVRQPGRGVWVFFQMRDLDHAPLLSDLVRWASSYRWARLFVFASRWQGTPTDWLAGQGRIDAAGLLRRCAGLRAAGEPSRPAGSGPVSDADFLICGPDAMVAELRQGLRDAGISAERIGSERFRAATGSRGVPAEQTVSQQPPQRCRVTLAGGARSFLWEQAHGTLLEAAEAAGEPWPSGCRQGDCGQCAVRVLRGRVAYAAPPSFDALAVDERLACLARPLEDVEVSLVNEAE